MKERALRFGAEGTLVGIVTEPSPETLRAGAPAIVVSNVGINHRVGPYRLWVELARRLAAAGFVTVRFDASGLGDSESAPGTRSDVERAISDTREAMEWLMRKKGIERFVLAGLCSGTDSVHALARDDARVVGAAFIDGYAFPTRASRLRHRLRFLSADRWRRLLRRRLLFSGKKAGAEEIYVRDYPTPQRMREELGRMLERRARLLYVYAGAEGHTYVYPHQFFDMLDAPELRGQVDVEFFERADHLFSLPSDRAALIERLQRFVDQVAAKQASAGTS